MAERYVHLVRHGRPLVDPEVPAERWRLDPAHLDEVRALGRAGRVPQDARWFCSPEPRARETAALLTDRDVEVLPDLREQVRLHAGWIEDFDAVLARAYAEPERSAYDGWEPLAATRLRISAVCRRLLREQPTGDLVLVGHGTALSLAAAELTDTAVNPRLPAAMGQPDVLTIRMSTPGPRVAPPLPLRQVLAGSVVVGAAETLSWELTRQPGFVVIPAAIVAGIVALPRQTRDVGISLLTAVLIGAFLALLVSGVVLRLD